MASTRKLSTPLCLVRRVVISAVIAIATPALVLIVLLFHRVAPPDVQTTLAAATELGARLKRAEKAASATSPQVVRIEQSELNSLVASSVVQDQSTTDEDGGNPVHDVRITLSNDLMRMYVLVDAYGKDLTLEVESKLRTINGAVQFEPVSGRIGALPIPRSLLESSMKKMMNSPEGRELLRLPHNMSDVHIEDGKIVATFR